MYDRIESDVTIGPSTYGATCEDRMEVIGDTSDIDRSMPARIALCLLAVLIRAGIARATSFAVVAAALLVQQSDIDRQRALAADPSAPEDSASGSFWPAFACGVAARVRAAEGLENRAPSPRNRMCKAPWPWPSTKTGECSSSKCSTIPTGHCRGNRPRDAFGCSKTGTKRGARATSVVADKLLFANGVMPWRDGLIVTSAPRIVWLRDTQNVGRADVSVPLYEGFAAGNPQLRCSYPLLGLDNGVYVANGQQGGRIRSSNDPNAPPVDIGGRDFRFDPISGRAEAVTGMGQFGNTFDDWGRRFVCTNRNHWIHTVLPEGYLRRNPNLAPPPRPHDDQGPGGAAKVYSLTIQSTTSLEHRGSFTAACGVFVYRGRLLPAEYRDAIYTCEPTGNLIHEEILLPKGATFIGHPAHNGREFLASRDNWSGRSSSRTVRTGPCMSSISTAKSSNIPNGCRRNSRRVRIFSRAKTADGFGGSFRMAARRRRQRVYPRTVRRQGSSPLLLTRHCKRGRSPTVLG